MSQERGKPWSGDEIDAAVESYFRLLRADLLQQKVVKRREIEKVQERVARTQGSVERKFQNISAILLELGAGGFVAGYVPLRNVQQALRESVAKRWKQEADIEELMVEAALERFSGSTPDLIWGAPPKFSVDFQASRRERTPVRTDFLKLDAQNRSLGLAGEQAVVELERRTLQDFGLHRLAREVEHVSQTQGDGLGFDVLSFDRDGNEKFIEVKTTRKPKEFPFLVTRNEVRFSTEEPERFHLYRLFGFESRQAGVFNLQGRLDESCALEPTVFEAHAGKHHQ